MQNANTNTQLSGIRIRVSDLLFAFQKRWLIIVALTLVGLAFGLILSAMSYVQTTFQSFEIKGSFAITTINANGLYINNASAANNNDYHLAEDMMDAVQYVVRSRQVLSQVINQEELLGYTTDQLANAITLSQYNATQIITMKLDWRNAEEGIRIWNDVVLYAGQKLPDTLQMGSLAIINEPIATMVGVGGGSNTMPVLLALVGLVAGVAYAVLELLMHPTLNNVRDVETTLGLETIGVIPWDAEHYKKKGSILVQEDGAKSDVLQSFSAASYILRNRLGTKEEHHCLYVTSATEQEGKSTVAANLAIQLSDMEHRTLLIDFDTRNPNLGSLFLDKVDYNRSLNALYRGEINEVEAITNLTGYLDLLPSVLEHNIISLDGAILDLIQGMIEKYEYVIIDAPPVGVVSDTLSLNQIANTVLFVVGYDKATIPEIQSALEKLDKSGIRVLGCIVNGVQNGRASTNVSKEEEKKRSLQKKAKERQRFSQEDERYLVADANTAAASEQDKTPAEKPAEKERKKKKGLFSFGGSKSADEKRQERIKKREERRKKREEYDDDDFDDFDDDDEELAEEPRANKRAVSSQAQSAHEPKLEKRLRLGKQNQKAQEEDQKKPADQAVVVRRGNVLDDLMDTEDETFVVNDQDAVQELLKLGFTDDWGNNKKNAVDQAEDAEDEDSKPQDEEQEDSPAPVRKSQSRSLPTTDEEDFDDEDDEEEELLPVRASRSRKAQPVIEEEAKVEPEEAKPVRKSSARKAAPVKKDLNRRRPAIDEEDDFDDEDDEEEELLPIRASRSRKAQPVIEEAPKEKPEKVKPARKPSTKKTTPVIEEEPEEVKPARKSSAKKAAPVIEEEPEEVKPARKSSAKKAAPVIEEEPEEVKPTRYQSSRNAAPVRKSLSRRRPTIDEEGDFDDEDDEEEELLPIRASRSRKAQPVIEEEPEEAKPVRKQKTKKAALVIEEEPEEVKTSRKSRKRKA